MVDFREWLNMSGVGQAVFMNQRSFGPIGPIGQQAFTTAGTFTWVAPAGVTSVSVVCVGPGIKYFSQYNAGGGLGYKNNISVTPGNSYTVRVGSMEGTQASSSDSYFISNVTVRGGSGTTSGGGTYTGDGGGNGGASGNLTVDPDFFLWMYGGGGGAGGYSGNGGAGGNGNEYASAGGTAGSGGSGGGGGGASGGNSANAKGGGVGLLGQGSNGAGGAASSGTPNDGSPGSGGSGQLYGGGGGEWSAGGTLVGAVRIIWGTGRAFPSTNTGNL
jgi:hypothetical protein